MKRALLLGLVLVASGLVAPAAAQETHGSTAGSNGVLYDDCVLQPYSYAVTVPDDSESWSLDTSAVGPDGQTADTGHVGNGEDLSGVGTFRLCSPPDLFGRYTIHATLDWVDADTTPHHEVLADSQFTMRKPFTRTTLSVSTRRPAYRQYVAYRIGVSDERPAGYTATPFVWVVLQKKVDGQWVRIKGSRTLTHSTGRVKLRLRYLRHHHKRLWVRAVAQESPQLSRSVSAPVRIW